MNINETYETNDGKEVTIAGLVQSSNSPEGERWYYSTGGNWYTEDGRFVMYTKDGGFRPLDPGNFRSLKTGAQARG